MAKNRKQHEPRYQGVAYVAHRKVRMGCKAHLVAGFLFVYRGKGKSMRLVILIIALGLIAAGCNEKTDPSLYDCDDFPNQDKAQEYYKDFYTDSDHDPYHLDTDGDGIACESLPGMLE